MNIITKTRKPQGSDLGLDGHGGPGKGSRARNNHSDEFRANYDRIFGKKKKKNRSRKPRYQTTWVWEGHP